MPPPPPLFYRGRRTVPVGLSRAREDQEGRQDPVGPFQMVRADPVARPNRLVPAHLRVLVHLLALAAPPNLEDPQDP
jgi:hypothetical protein